MQLRRNIRQNNPKQWPNFLTFFKCFYLQYLLSKLKVTTQRAHHVESTSFWRGYYVDTSKTKFRRISTSFRVLSRRHFDGRKMHVVSMYFLRLNFDGQKIHVISTYFYWCNFAGRKFHVVSTYFLRCNFDDRKIHVVSTYFF